MLKLIIIKKVKGRTKYSNTYFQGIYLIKNVSRAFQECLFCLKNIPGQIAKLRSWKRLRIGISLKKIDTWTPVM